MRVSRANSFPRGLREIGCLTCIGAETTRASQKPVAASDTNKHAMVPSCGAVMHDRHNMWSKGSATRGQLCTSDKDPKN